MKIRTYFVFWLILLLVRPGTLCSETITIEVSAVASGSLGASNFTDAAMTLTGVGDTENVQTNGDISTLLDGLEVFVEVENVGSAMFTDQIQAVSNNNSELGGFGNSSNDFGLLLIFNEAFANYSLTTNLESVSGFGVIVIGVAHETTSGSLRLFSISGDATFSAEVSQDCEFQPGDVNQDGVVDLLDVAPFVELLTGSSFSCEADVNDDGEVNLLDVDIFVSLFTGS